MVQSDILSFRHFLPFNILSFGILAHSTFCTFGVCYFDILSVNRLCLLLSLLHSSGLWTLPAACPCYAPPWPVPLCSSWPVRTLSAACLSLLLIFCPCRNSATSQSYSTPFWLVRKYLQLVFYFSSLDRTLPEVYSTLCSLLAFPNSACSLSCSPPSLLVRTLPEESSLTTPYGPFWTLAAACTVLHRWALSPISVISDIGLSLISELPISDWESGVRHYIGYRNKLLSNTWYPTSQCILSDTVA
jgi:hypothetical protein